ncbi:MAG: hypothetical protein ACPLXL_02205 [Minisyncoccia bacterium]
MKKLLTISSFIFLAFILGTNILFAEDYNLQEIPNIDLDPFTKLWDAINWFFNIVIILCIIFIIYAGFTYVTSGGDPGKTKKALQILIYALIGLAVAILAKALINLVSHFLGAGQIIQENTGGQSGGISGSASGGAGVGASGSGGTNKPAEVYNQP